MTDANIKKIILKMLPDGSWVGRTIKYGKKIEVREAKPEDALMKLLTHDGN